MRPPLSYKQLCETCAAPQVVILRTNHTRTNSHISQIIFRRLLDKPGSRGAKDSKYTAAISQDSRPSDAVGYDASLCVRICMRAYMHACVYACGRTQTPSHYSCACIHAANLQDPQSSDARPVRAFLCIARWLSHASMCVDVFYGCICMHVCGSAWVYIMYSYFYRI